MAESSSLVLGVLLDWFSGSYQSELVDGIEEEAKKRGISVIYFPGRKFNDTVNSGIYFNRLYDLIGPEYIDGLLIPVLITGELMPPALEDYLSRFAPIPMVTLSFECNQAFSVKIDNRGGFHDLMDHMIRKHGFRKFAFIHGPEDHPDAIIRYAVFKEVLASCHIDVEENKTVYGGFAISNGIRAVTTFLDERKFRLKEDIEVFICSNDLIAIGVLRELERRGFSVPGDVAVTGFDDIEEGRRRMTPLTTVRHPIRGLGKEGVKAFALKKSPEKLLPTCFLPRATCGCTLSNKDINPGLPPPPPGKGLEEFLVQGVCKIIFPRDGEDWDITGPEKLINYFLKPPPGYQLPALKSEIYNFFVSWFNKWAGLENWLEALIFLENNIPPGQDPGITKSLFQYSHLIIEDLNHRIEMNKHSKIREWEERLRWVNGALMASMNLDDISVYLAKVLPELLDIHESYIFLYTSPRDYCNNFKLLNNKKNSEEQTGQRHRTFTNFQAIINTFLDREQPYSFIIQSLVFTNENMGFIILDYNEEARLSYDSLRIHVTTAIKHSLTILESANRNQKLKKLQSKLVQSAHQAGMAQIAINLMHNIGNILNNTYITLDESYNRLKKSVFHRFRKANDLFRHKKNKKEFFLKKDPRGEILPDYYLKLEELMENENRSTMHDIRELEKKISSITNVINAQMELSKGIFISERINLVESLENSLILKNDAIQKAKVKLVKHYKQTDKFFISCYQNKIVHILVKLLEFAIRLTLKGATRIITIDLGCERKKILLKITNTGGGIDEADLIKIFHQKYDTPNISTSIDFHFIANSLTEIGASIQAESKGPDQGAAIIIFFPG